MSQDHSKNADSLKYFSVPLQGLDLRSSYLWWAVLPLSIVLFGDMVLDSAASRFKAWSALTSPCGLDANNALDPAQALSEAAGRLWLAISTFALIAISCGSFAYSSWSTYRLLSRAAFILIIKALFVVLGIYVLVFWLGRYSSLSLKAYEILGPGIMPIAEACARYQGGGRLVNVLTIGRLIDFTSIFLALTAGIIVFATIACLAEPQVPADGLLEHVQHWKYQSRRSEELLIIGAAVLVVGIIFHICWTSWPEFLFKKGGEKGPDAEKLSAYRSLISAYAGYKAVQYTLFLSVFYTPVFLLLSVRAEEISRQFHVRSGGGGTEIGLLQELNSEYGRVFKVLAAVFAPIATGILGQLLQASSK